VSLGPAYRYRNVRLRTMVVIRRVGGSNRVAGRSHRWKNGTLGQGLQSGWANAAASGDVLPDCIALPALFAALT
jgi:hypothetical protein